MHFKFGQKETPAPFSRKRSRKGIRGQRSQSTATKTVGQAARLTPWQINQLADAKISLAKRRKNVVPGRIVAELNFGFWTGFFNKAHGQTGIGHYLASKIYPHAPLAEQNLNKLGIHWQNIRNLRNRVFHHERILHWRDLDARHQAILEIVSWISPELHELTTSLDRFPALRKAGLKPWIAKLEGDWAVLPFAATSNSSTVEILSESFDATDGERTPFGYR